MAKDYPEVTIYVYCKIQRDLSQYAYAEFMFHCNSSSDKTTIEKKNLSLKMELKTIEIYFKQIEILVK